MVLSARWRSWENSVLVKRATVRGRERCGDGVCERTDATVPRRNRAQCTCGYTRDGLLRGFLLAFSAINSLFAATAASVWRSCTQQRQKKKVFVESPKKQFVRGHGLAIAKSTQCLAMCDGSLPSTLGALFRGCWFGRGMRAVKMSIHVDDLLVIGPKDQSGFLSV